MLRGLYTAGTGMLTESKKMDVLTNNIANAETRGFKQDKLLSRSFRDMLISRINDPSVLLQEETVGPLSPGIHIDEVFTDFAQGPLEETGKNTDLALEGQGFFVVNTPEGERYTRNGVFQLDQSGRLTTPDGFPVQGINGDIIVGTEDFSVSEKGAVTVNGTAAGLLRIVNFADPAGLRKTGGNLYESTGAGQPAESDARVAQGVLEGSNVDLADQFVNMIQISRSYETNQRIIKMIDESLGRAVNDIGRV